MAITVKKAQLWRRDLDHKPGTLAEALKPFAQDKVNLQVVMGYKFPNSDGQAALEIYPVTDGKSESAAKKAGFKPAENLHCLIVEGDDQVGLGYEMAEAVSGESININFSMIHVIDKKFVGIFGFASADAADKASGLLKRAGELVKKA